jgi:hypothetical protein
MTMPFESNCAIAATHFILSDTSWLYTRVSIQWYRTVPARRPFADSESYDCPRSDTKQTSLWHVTCWREEQKTNDTRSTLTGKQ